MRQLTAGGTATFVYDSVGNVLVKQHQGQPPLTMSYDPASRLTTRLYAAATTAYSYDRAGNLLLEDQAGAQISRARRPSS